MKKKCQHRFMKSKTLPYPVCIRCGFINRFDPLEYLKKNKNEKKEEPLDRLRDQQDNHINAYFKLIDIKTGKTLGYTTMFIKGTDEELDMLNGIKKDGVMKYVQITKEEYYDSDLNF